MKRVALVVVTVCLLAAFAVSPSHAVVGAWALGTGTTTPDTTPETLTVLVGRVDAAVGPTGLIVYESGAGAVAISIQCALWETSTPHTILHASGIDTGGATWYATVRDTGPGQVADDFALRTTPTGGQLCSSPTTGFKAVPGGSFVIGYA